MYNFVMSNSKNINRHNSQETDEIEGIKVYGPKLENNNGPEKLWFRAKSYGWGWTPASWEGWAVTTLFICSVIFGAAIIVDVSPKFYTLFIFANVIALIFICYKKGERPEWRWKGKPVAKSKIILEDEDFEENE